MEHRPEIESFAFGKAKHPCGRGEFPKRPGNFPKTPGTSKNTRGTSQKHPELPRTSQELPKTPVELPNTRGTSQKHPGRWWVVGGCWVGGFPQHPGKVLREWTGLPRGTYDTCQSLIGRRRIQAYVACHVAKIDTCHHLIGPRVTHVSNSDWFMSF
jgi:hypothetical protein